VQRQPGQGLPLTATAPRDAALSNLTMGSLAHLRGASFILSGSHTRAGSWQ
jgi:hypothetical protein